MQTALNILLRASNNKQGIVCLFLTLSLQCALPSLNASVPSGRQKSKKMSTEPVQVHLTVDVAGEKAEAHLTYTNVSNAVVSLDKLNACLNGEVNNNVFVIVSEGKPIQYALPLKKRRGAKAQDVVRLAAGKSLHTDVYLDSAYHFPAGTHTYHISYEAFHDDPHSEALLELKSNPVTFTLTKSHQ